ncbi:MAG: DUF2178 domain-containing protein [Candidatus Woesearchaeota archaeon]|nr:MAG: DUF2178 domain-containing protein [Candidatus Woesearchaeota archaeon]
METKSKDKLRIAAIIIIGLLVIATGALFSLTAFIKGDIYGGIMGILIAIIIFIFAIFVYIRGNKDLKKGLPLKDERSRKVIEKATSKAFLVSLYLLLAIGFLSDDIIHFRDVSQATGISVAIMAILFAVFWAYYNKKEL